VSHLKVRKNDAVLKEPLFYADRVDVHLRWGPLLAGRWVGTVDGQGVKVVIEQPDPEGENRLPSMEELLPVKAVVGRGARKAAEARRAWARDACRATLPFADCGATLESVHPRRGLTDRPAVLAARGTVQRSGTMVVRAAIEPLATPVEYAVETTIEHFDLSQM